MNYIYVNGYLSDKHTIVIRLMVSTADAFSKGTKVRTNIHHVNRLHLLNIDPIVIIHVPIVDWLGN